MTVLRITYEQYDKIKKDPRMRFVTVSGIQTEDPAETLAVLSDALGYKVNIDPDGFRLVVDGWMSITAATVREQL